MDPPVLDCKYVNFHDNYNTYLRIVNKLEFDISKIIHHSSQATTTTTQSATIWLIIYKKLTIRFVKYSGDIVV